MTYLITYLLLSPTLATLHIANVYYREWRANRKARRAREDEPDRASVRDLEWLFDMEAREPERRVS